MSLVAAKPILQQKIQECAYEAMYEAFMSTMLGGKADPAISLKIENDMKMAGQKYAQKFSEKIAPKLAQAIFNFVFDISISLTPAGSLLAPQAPTGVLPVQGVSSTEIGDITVT